MGRKLASALALFVALLAAMALNHPTMAQTPEQKIWSLLGDSEAPYVSLGEADFRALGAGFDLPDGGKAITRLAEQAPGGAFDPRDVAKLSPQQLGYKADWVVERFRRYNLDWDIGGLRLEEPRSGGEELSVVHHHERRRREPLRVPRRPQEPSGLGAVSGAEAQRHDREHSRQFQIWRLGSAGHGRRSASPPICSTATSRWTNTRCAMRSTPTPSSCRG